MPLWAAHTFPLLLPSSNLQQSSSNFWLSVGESCLLRSRIENKCVNGIFFHMRCCTRDDQYQDFLKGNNYQARQFLCWRFYCDMSSLQIIMVFTIFTLTAVGQGPSGYFVVVFISAIGPIPATAPRPCSHSQYDALSAQEVFWDRRHHFPMKCFRPHECQRLTWSFVVMIQQSWD